MRLKKHPCMMIYSEHGELSMQHLAIIPDGNRRWAARNKLGSFFGHQKGAEAFHSAIAVCLKNNIKYLSFYTFSLENFRRSDEEKHHLWHDILGVDLEKRLPQAIEQGIRIRFLGDTRLFPEKLMEYIRNAEEKTKHGTKLQVNLLFCYGAQQEIVHATQRLAQDVQEGKLKSDEISSETIKDYLWTAGTPDPDLIIRTGNVFRLSNFLLFQAAYSEFMFLDCFWPEVTQEVLQKSLYRFELSQRNFGK